MFNWQLRRMLDENSGRTFFYSYASNRPKYECLHLQIDADTTDKEWYVVKFSDADLPTIEGPRRGAVNSEAVVNAFDWVT